MIQRERWEGEKEEIQVFERQVLELLHIPPPLPHPSHVFSTHSVLKCPSGDGRFHPAPSGSGENQEGCKCLGVREALKLIP